MKIGETTNNNPLEQGHQSEEVLPVEKAESVSSEMSFMASTTSHKMKIDELTGEETEHAMEVDSLSNSTKPSSNTNLY